MILLLTSSKTMQFSAGTPTRTEPLFAAEAQILAQAIQRLKVDELRALMKISEPLAEQTREQFARFAKGSGVPTTSGAALFCFRGDVYECLNADAMDASALEFAQAHLRILSGLYGILRPLDCIQPYRLEMGYKLKPAGESSLRAFGKPKLTQMLNEELRSSPAPAILNLASKEYTDALDLKALERPLISPRFLVEQAGGQRKNVALYAKRGRGALAGYVCRLQIQDPSKLAAFTDDGWNFDPEASSEAEPVFIRRL